uniref:Putative group i salivary lipocalin n=1 Tax=Rhipicephalus pulchellus TaxID=72859 RepID=L7LTJ0_RHIPC
MLRVIIVSFISIAAAHFDYLARPSIHDAKKFYQDGQIIYLVMRTYISKINGQDPTCIHNKVHNWTNENLYFDHKYSYKYGHLPATVSRPVHAKFSTKLGIDVAPLVTASCNAEPKMTRNYYFHYYDDKAHCAVLTFKDDSGTLRCELHTWKSTASYTRYGNCHDEYKYQCPGRKSHYVYLSDCPDAV